MDRAPHPTPEGDSLYTASIVALNPDTGKLVWAYQVTPHDTHDYDAGQTPIIFDGEFQGQAAQATGASFPQWLFLSSRPGQPGSTY